MVLVLNPIWVDCIWRIFAFLLNILSGEGLQYMVNLCLNMNSTATHSVF